MSDNLYLTKPIALLDDYFDDLVKDLADAYYSNINLFVKDYAYYPPLSSNIKKNITPLLNTVNILSLSVAFSTIAEIYASRNKEKELAIYKDNFSNNNAFFNFFDKTKDELSMLNDTYTRFTPIYNELIRDGLSLNLLFKLQSAYVDNHTVYKGLRSFDNENSIFNDFKAVSAKSISHYLDDFIKAYNKPCLSTTTTFSAYLILFYQFMAIAPFGIGNLEIAIILLDWYLKKNNIIAFPTLAFMHTVFIYLPLLQDIFMKIAGNKNSNNNLVYFLPLAKFLFKYHLKPNFANERKMYTKLTNHSISNYFYLQNAINDDLLAILKESLFRLDDLPSLPDEDNIYLEKDPNFDINKFMRESLLPSDFV